MESSFAAGTIHKLAALWTIIDIFMLGLLNEYGICFQDIQTLVVGMKTLHQEESVF